MQIHGQNYTFRQARQEDAGYLRQLHHIALRDAVEKIWGWDQATQDKFFNERFKPEMVQIILVDNAAVGCLSVEERVSEVFLASILISPQFQNRGLGSQIVGDIISKAMKRKLKVSLTVLKSNRAKALYERLGFMVTSEDENRYFMAKE